MTATPVQFKNRSRFVSHKLGTYRGRYVDINRGQFTDSTYTTRGRMFPEVGCPETKTDPVDYRPILNFSCAGHVSGSEFQVLTAAK